MRNNIVQTENKKIIKKKIGCFLFSLLMMYSTFWFFEKFVDDFQDVSIGVDKQKQICVIEQSKLFMKPIKTEAFYVENFSAEYMKKTHGRYPSTYNVKLPCMTKDGWFEVYKRGNLMSFPARWITDNFNKNNKNESLNSFQLNLERGEFYKNFYFYYELFFVIACFCFACFFLYGTFFFKYETLATKAKDENEQK